MSTYREWKEKMETKLRVKGLMGEEGNEERKELRYLYTGTNSL